MKKRSFFIRLKSLLLFFLITSSLSLNAQNDSIIFTFQSFIEQVLTHHPIAQKAALQIQKAEATQLAAKGEFDPTLFGDWNEKYFDEKHYYRIFEAGFKVPTWYGISVQGTYTNTRGDFLNPENKTDDNGLWMLGVEANLLQGLLIDQRRAALQQADVYEQATLNERQMILNDLVIHAINAYVSWQLNFEVQKVLQDNIELAQIYKDGTQQSYINGEKPAIDTLEAFLMVQDSRMRFKENEGNLIKVQQALESYLWYEQIPLELQDQRQPEPLADFNIAGEDVSIESVLQTHPDILDKKIKQNSYEIEQRLKRDKLKPKLKVKYNPLISTTENSLAWDYSTADYKWGVNFSMPLFLRSERASIAQNQIKVKEIGLEIRDKQNALQNKIEGNLQIQQLLEEQLNIQRQNVVDYERLLNAEKDKFGFGESSVFLLNKRQEKFLESKIKLLKVLAKYHLMDVEYLLLTNQILTFLGVEK